MLLVTGVLLAPAAVRGDDDVPPPPPGMQVIERVVAVVNDHAIFLSQLRRRAVPFLDQALSAPTQQARVARLSQLYHQLLDQLIDEDLIQQTAHDMQVTVTADDVDRAIHNVQQQSGLDDNAFWQAVRGQGFTEAQYRADVRRQLLRLKVLNQRTRGQVNINERDVRRKYDQMVREQNRHVCMHVSMVFFPIPDGASATDMARIRDKAIAVRQGLTADNFAQAIDQNAGGDLGRVCEGELAPALEHVLLAMQIGQISQPVRGPNGYHIFLLARREHESNGVGPYEQMRDQIYRKMLETAMQHQEQVFLSELHHKAVIVKHL